VESTQNHFIWHICGLQGHESIAQPLAWVTADTFFIASCPSGAPEFRNVASQDFLPPLQGGSVRNINPG
jgi:hypothetical protein